MRGRRTFFRSRHSGGGDFRYIDLGRSLVSILVLIHPLSIIIIIHRHQANQSRYLRTQFQLSPPFIYPNDQAIQLQQCPHESTKLQLLRLRKMLMH